MVSGLIFGCAPAWLASHDDPNAALKGQVSHQFGRGFPLRDWLATGQIALSLVLLIASGLCLRSFAGLLTANPGFNTRELVVAPVEFHAVAEATTGNFYRELVQRLTALPGIRSVSWTRVLPLLGGGMSVPVERIEGYIPKANEFLNVEFSEIGARYFETIGTAIVTNPDRPVGNRGTLVWVDLPVESEVSDGPISMPAALESRSDEDDVSHQSLLGVDVLQDTVGDPILTAHAYLALKDAQYEKKKREPVFEFELKGKK